MNEGELHLDRATYASSIGDEIFLQYINGERDIAGFLRLSLPLANEAPLTEELRGAAMIREVACLWAGAWHRLGAEGAGAACGAGHALDRDGRGNRKGARL